MTAAPLDPVALDQDGRVASDLACVKCGYNLRSATTDGRCPECGLAVGRSAVGHWLRYCEPDWLRGVWRGLNRLGIALVAVVTLSLFEWAGVYRRFSELSDTMLFLTNALIAAAAVFAVIGFAMATSPDPARLAEPVVNARRAGRVALIGAVVLMIAALGVSPYVGRRLGGQPIEWVAIGVMAVLTFGFACLLWHARSLANRAPNAWLAHFTFAHIVVTVVSVVLLLARFSSMGVVTSSIYKLNGLVIRSGLDPTGIRDELRIAALTGLVLSVVGTIALFLGYYAVMSKQARLARRTWASQPFQASARGESANA